MIRSVTRMSWLILLLFVASFAAAQTEFSADIFDIATNAARSKVYSSKDKLRLESAKKDAEGGAVIVDLATETSTIIMDQRHMYMEMPPQMASQRNTYHFFRTGDAESACSDWLAQVWNKGGTCHKVGPDTVNGRKTVKYEGTNSKGEPGTIWLDPKLRFPVKWQGKNNGGELRNIQEGPQPASLFEVPAGYTKFDMSNMMKHPQ